MTRKDPRSASIAAPVRPGKPDERAGESRRNRGSTHIDAVRGQLGSRLTECLLRERKLSTDDLQMASIILANGSVSERIGEPGCLLGGIMVFASRKPLFDCRFSIGFATSFENVVPLVWEHINPFDRYELDTSRAVARTRRARLLKWPPDNMRRPPT